MQVETTVGMLDHYLLTGQASIQDVMDCLARHGEMPYLRHLEISGLNEGLPDDEQEAVRRLIRLRLLFADHMELHDPKSESALSEQLYCLRSLHTGIRDFVSGEVNRRDLERQVGTVSRSSEANAMVCQTVFELRCVLAEYPEEVQRPDVLNACFKTLRRIEALWFAILG